MNAFDLMAKISLDTSGYEKSLDEAEGEAEKKGGSIASKFANGLKSGVKAIATAGTAIAGATMGAMAGIAKVGMAYNQEMETYTTNFTTMLGDEQKAVEKVNELKKFASSTPLSMADLAQGTQTLLAFGVASEDSTETLRMLGDIALGDAQKMQSLANSFGKATASGKVSGEVVQSMISAGWNPLVEITKMTGESMEQVQKRMSEGAISADELTEAMKHATSEGGQFAGGMEKASHTTAGLISTLQDNVKALAGLVSGQLSESFKTDLLPTALDAVANMTTAFEEEGGDMFNGVSRSITSVAKFISNNSKTILKVFKGVVKYTSQTVSTITRSVTNVFRGVVSGFNTVKDSLGGFSIDFETIFGLFDDTLHYLGVIAGNVFSGIGSLIATFINTAKPLFEGFGGSIKDNGDIFGDYEMIVSNVVDGISLVFKTLGTVVESVTGVFVRGFQWIREQAETEGTPINTAITAIKDGIGKLGEKISEWTQPIKDFFSGIGTDGKQSGDDVSGAWNAVYGAIDSIVRGIKTWIEEVVKFYGSLFEESDGTASTVETAWNTVMNVIDTVKHAIDVAVKFITEKFGNAGKSSDDFKEKTVTMGGVLSAVFAVLKWTIDTSLQAINDALKVINDFLNGDFSQAWKDVKKYASNFWESVKNLANAYAPGVVKMLEGIEKAVSAISGAIETAIGWIIAWNQTRMEDKQARVTTMHEGETGDGNYYGGGHSRKFAKAYDNPYLLDTATVFGRNGDSALIGGEMGAKNGGELIYSREKLMKDIAYASGTNELSIVAYQILEVILEYFPLFAQPPVIDGDSLTKELTPRISKEMARRKERGYA